MFELLDLALASEHFAFWLDLFSSDAREFGERS